MRFRELSVSTDGSPLGETTHSGSGCTGSNRQRGCVKKKKKESNSDRFFQDEIFCMDCCAVGWMCLLHMSKMLCNHIRMTICFLSLHKYCNIVSSMLLNTSSDV